MIPKHEALAREILALTPNQPLLQSVQESAIQRLIAEVRLATLREVRKEAYAMDRHPDNDPYSWGYGGGKISEMISAKVREAREGASRD